MSCKEFALDNLVSILAVPVSKPLDAVPTGIESLAGLNADADAVTIGSYALADTLVRLVPDTGKATDTSSDNTAGRLHTVTVKCEADCRDDRAVELLRKLERTPSHIVVTSNNGERFGVYATQHTYLCEVEQDAEKTNVTIRIQCMKGLQRIVSAKSIVLDPPSLSLQPGCSGTLKATVLPENATNREVEWSTSDPNIARVDANGKVTAVATVTGSQRKDCWIYCKAKDGSGVQAKCRCAVANILIERITLSPGSIIKHPGAKITLTADIKPSTATNKSVKWFSSSPGVVSVFGDGSLKATVLANGIGNAEITCIANDGSGVFAKCACTITQSYVSSITIEPRSIAVSVNNTETLKATVKPDNATDKTVIWSSSDTSVATVDEHSGIVTGVAEGTCTITCTAADGSGVQAQCACEVKEYKIDRIDIAGDIIAVLAGYTKKINATIVPDNATNTQLQWVSSDTSVATVDSDGIVTGVAEGTCTITCTATDGSGVEAECSVEVFAEYVDLGLPSGTLWASRNIGAYAPDDIGGFFAWGDTEQRPPYNVDNYKFHVTGNMFSKYVTRSAYGVPDGKTILEPTDDAATAINGNGWSIPTNAQVKELLDDEYTTKELTRKYGVLGLLVTGRANGKSVFLPACGNYNSGKWYNSGGYYWQSLLDITRNYSAYSLCFKESVYIHDEEKVPRHNGLQIRPVYHPQESSDDSDSSSSQESSSEDSDSSGSDSSEA